MTVTFFDRPDVRLITHSGGDESVLAAMLVSTQGDESLAQLTADPEAGAGRIRFLMKNRHGTPFEHNQFRFYVKAPIFVFREFHRHRIGWSYNEESGRYKQLEPEFYMPGSYRPLVQVGKPGAYSMVPATYEQWSDGYNVVSEACVASYHSYEMLLALGWAKEIARTVLPVGIYSSMYATCNARSLMSFLSLRTDDDRATIPSKPLYEIQQVSEALEASFVEHMPITYEAWNDFGRVAP